MLLVATAKMNPSGSVNNDRDYSGGGLISYIVHSSISAPVPSAPRTASDTTAGSTGYFLTSIVSVRILLTNTSISPARDTTTSSFHSPGGLIILRCGLCFLGAFCVSLANQLG